jgi:hypothetical protein
MDIVPATAETAIDPVVESFRRALVEVYGPALDRVVLFGSRARGDANAESDSLWAEWDRLADLRVRFLDEGGPFIEAVPFLVSDFNKPSPLMHEIRKDGLTL